LQSGLPREAFDHCVFLGRRAVPVQFEQSIVIGQSSRGGNGEHLEGLHKVMEYFLQRRADYEGFLVLDSDAFPIRSDWMAVLDGYIERFHKNYAGAVRTENLDVFPHPCIAYSRYPEYLVFDRVTSVNLLGEQVADVACIADGMFPLIKCNQLSVHPTISTIYSDLFYHHGCGSRAFWMRSIGRGYYDHIATAVSDPRNLIEMLKIDAEEYIARLRFGSARGSGIPDDIGENAPAFTR